VPFDILESATKLGGYLIFDRGSSFNAEMVDAVKTFEIQPKRTSFRSPWQNGIAERWIGNCRRDLLDHLIVVNERHLKRLMGEYIRYYHKDRTNLGLGKQTPVVREAAEGTNSDSKVVSIPRLGGLHHSYDLAAGLCTSINSHKPGYDRQEICAFRRAYVHFATLLVVPGDR
jgi:Integrase core domain